ncbi:MAG: hypothetical protein AAGU19_00285 [Prolixibacteraceae bacterium]
MIEEFGPIAAGIRRCVGSWENRFLQLPGDVITERRNSQQRNIKQLVGHMIHSASNNTRRMAHLQYQPSPFRFPNYASIGNNEQWIASQNYQEADWQNLVMDWKYANLHVAHVITRISEEKLNHQWISGTEELVSLKDMVIDYLLHLHLHLDEIEDLLSQH